MDELQGKHRDVGYALAWVRTVDDVIWRAALDNDGQTVGWPSGRFSIAEKDQALVPWRGLPLRITSRGHLPASVARWVKILV
jgi:hypothetical protein